VQQCLTTLASRPVVRKKAALCLLRLFRKAPEILNHDEFAMPLYGLIEQEKDLGVLLCYVNLLGGLAAVCPAPYARCQPLVVGLLSRLDQAKEIPPGYTYYGLASPFLQVRHQTLATPRSMR
jgi:AP-2 complex subunit alpha